jgi:hypothetical protein
MWVLRISRYNKTTSPKGEGFLYSHHLHVKQCVGIVRATKRCWWLLWINGVGNWCINTISCYTLGTFVEWWFLWIWCTPTRKIILLQKSSGGELVQKKRMLHFLFFLVIRLLDYCMKTVLIGFQGHGKVRPGAIFQEKVENFGPSL